MAELRKVTLKGALDGAQIRTARFQGRDHLVVPVVMMKGDAVVRPLGSKGPEYVPAAELAKSAPGWAGRPVVPDHPVGEDGVPISANDPRLLETASFGSVFAPRFDGDLKAEAWLDPARASEIGEAAAKVCERVAEGKMVEISIGAWVRAQADMGRSPGGDEYEVSWRDVVPDHLAMGLGGSRGACSVEMGCGAPRIAKGEPMNQSLLSRALSAIRRLASGVSDNDLREMLSQALRATEPGFDYILEVYPDDGRVVYATSPEGEELLWERGFSVEGEEASLAGEPVEVKMEMEFKPVSQGPVDDPPAQKAAECGCTTGQAAQGESMSKTIEALVGRLIDCNKSPFDETDREALQGFPEERLQALADGYAAQPALKPKASEADPETVTLTREEHAAMKAAAEAHQRAEDARRAELVAAIAQVATQVAPEELAGVPTETLQKMADGLKASAKRVDYSGQPVATEGGDSSVSMPACSWGLDAEKEAN